MTRRKDLAGLVLLICIGIGLVLPVVPASAHCDSLDGPVVADARAALQKGDVTPVLKWVKKDQEAEVRTAFQKTLVVRSKGPEARNLADNYFFETLVRLHRASEGAPYTGLKPAGTDLGPAVTGADKALQTGKVDSLVQLITGDVAAGIRERFDHTVELKKHENDSVEAGRKYVEAYIEFVHYVERLHAEAAGASVHHEESPAKTEEAEH